MNSTTKSRNWILKGRITNSELQNLTNLGPHTFNCCSFGSVPCKGTCPKATFSDHQNLEHHTLKWMPLEITQIFLQFYKIVLPWILKNLDLFAWLLKSKSLGISKLGAVITSLDSWKFHSFFWQILVSQESILGTFQPTTHQCSEATNTKKAQKAPLEAALASRKVSLPSPWPCSCSFKKQRWTLKQCQIYSPVGHLRNRQTCGDIESVILSTESNYHVLWPPILLAGYT